MADTTKYECVKVTLGVGIERNFDFEIAEPGRSDQLARITTPGYEMTVSKNLVYLGGDMPREWREPVMSKLRALLDAKEFPEGP